VGIILQAKGNRAEALHQYEAVLARNPNAGVAANNLAWMMAEDGRLDEAMKYATVAAEELPDLPEAQDTLGWVYLRKNLPGHAQTSFQRALNLAPQNATYKQHLQQAIDAAR